MAAFSDLPLDEPHRVEGAFVLRVVDQFVDRHDVGVLQLAGDLGFAHKALHGLVAGGHVRADLLQRHLAVQPRVAGQPDAPQAALAVNLGQRVVGAFFGRGLDGVVTRTKPAGGIRCEIVRSMSSSLTSRSMPRTFASAAMAQGLPRVAVVLLQLTFDEPFDLLTLRGLQPTAFDQDLGQRDSLRVAQAPQTSTNCVGVMYSNCSASTPKSRLVSVFI